MASVTEELNSLYSFVWIVDPILDSTVLEYFNHLDNFF